jgi:hypothetical protein
VAIEQGRVTPARATSARAKAARGSEVRTVTTPPVRPRRVPAATARVAAKRRRS